MTSLAAPADRRLARRITFFVALAVFAQEATWDFYDAQVPPLLREHITSTAVVGLLMGMDNLLGVFVQPWIANRSDNTRTRWGRRIPYLAVGMPVAAVLFTLIPLATALPALIAIIFVYSLAGNSFKPIAQALLPDFIEPERRGRANAVVKIASGLTVIVSALISAFLVDDHPRLAFTVPAVLMLACTAVLVLRVRDNTSRAYQLALTEDSADEPAVRLRDVVKDIVRDPNRSRLLVVVAVLLFASAWFSSRSLFTPYGMETLGLSRGTAGSLTFPSGVAFLLAAYPAALLAERIGRIRTMTIGMVVFGAALALGTVVPTPAATVAAFCVAAAGASGFLINAAVVLWNLAPSARVIGVYTGLYTVSWAVGGFIGPGLVGAMVDVTGWRYMLLDIALLAALAVAVVLRVSVLARRHATSL
ncbi:MFS transporter [Lentzea flaviverrucosa]|uniref:Na+/melibiose symporter n=1 Tax=Lentzea flaviverrucosa TaxID=200379 RepID=A0A1H9A146_9PSEU|nr:MFS transporter [Lentzea flaviverrucosa]RDI32192.1 Na+/melibiose symporter-like transporter [Lentzea flaviverrucosa]SEP70452.1 Na+/melibiose symporter [Lentzea flaviverrucosa]